MSRLPSLENQVGDPARREARTRVLCVPSRPDRSGAVADAAQVADRPGVAVGPARFSLAAADGEPDRVDLRRIGQRAERHQAADR